MADSAFIGRHELPNPCRIAALMQAKLKKRYQSHKEVSRNSHFEGLVNIGDLPRLCELLACQQGRVAVQFKFSNSDYKTAMVSGKLNTSLQLECQRCLQPLQDDLELDFHLLIDATDDIVRASGFDTLYSEAGYIDIFEMIEDEIILAIPLVVMHENNTCNQHWQTIRHRHEPGVKENPFSILQDLKTEH